jgi:hypothetical protein
MGGLGMTFQYDVEGRLSRAFQTNATTQGKTYTPMTPSIGSPRAR